MKYLIASVLLLAGCSDPAPNGSPRASALQASAQTAPVGTPQSGAATVPPDDVLGAPVEDYVAPISGKFELWQNDRGDDAWMCEVELLGTRTIGGYGITGDEACLRKIGIEDLSAWFVADEDGYLVLIDATRRPVMRLQKVEDGYYYFGNDAFYLSRGE